MQLFPSVNFRTKRMEMSSAKKPSLFDDSSDSDVDFKVNKGYADNYEKWRCKEEQQKLKDKYGDDLSTSSSESEEEEPVIEKDFLKTLSLLKSKDPQIYDESKTFFNEAPHTKQKPKEKKSKPLYLKDYERELILENDGELSDEDEKTVICPTYDDEQKEIKETFKAALMDSESDNEDDTLLQVRVKDKAQKEKEEEEYIQWLKGQAENISDEGGKKDLKFLHDYWNDPNLDESESFLKDYILNKKYAEDKSDAVPSYEEITNDIGNLSDDEEMLEKQAMFEHKYNFRFEEPDTEFIKQYPRTIGDSLRKKDNRRKLKREEYQERKKQEKEQKKEEIKRLKSIMRKEMEEKWNKLKEITGDDNLNFDQFDLEEDFDPAEHDKKMKELFSEDYYKVEEHDKPEFPSDEEFQCDNWDNWTGDDQELNGEEYDVPHCEDPNFVMDADYDPKLEFQKQMVEASKSKKKRKKSKFAAALSQEKPVFDPAAKSFERYFDEYYKLDCEDIIGDLPVRYKYHRVVPNDFGLSVEEVLAARDKELNRWCSIKKTCQYRSEQEELNDVQAFKRRAANEALKKKIFLSLLEKSEQDPDGATTNEVPKRKRKKKGKKKETGEESNAAKADEETSVIKNVNKVPSSQPQSQGHRSSEQQESTSSNTQQQTSASKKRKRKKKKANGVAENGAFKATQPNNSQTLQKAKRFKADDNTTLQISDNRLKAYGINPNKYRRDLKYSKKKC